MIGYVRVSTHEQAVDGHGLDAQRTAILADCGRRGIVPRFLADEGQTGKHLDRPALREALELIAAGDENGLIVAKLDRLTRSVIDFSTLLEWFDAAGAQLVALDLNIDTSSSSGRLVATVMAAVAEWERGVISERTSAGLRAAQAQGQVIGPDSVRDRPQVAETIRGMRDRGMTLRAICDALNEQSVPTARGGQVWRPSSVQTVLGYQRRKTRRPTIQLPEVKAR